MAATCQPHFMPPDIPADTEGLVQATGLCWVGELNAGKLNMPC